MSSPAAAFAGCRVLVAGLGVSGPPAARLLAAAGAQVTAVDARDDAGRRELAAELAGAGVSVRLGEAAAARPPAGTGLVVTSPGWRPDAPLLAAAAAAGVPVLGDVELAWRLRPQLPGGGRQQWLAVTGTNGKTTTIRMLAAMLAAAGHRSVAAGNVGLSVIDAVTQPEPYPVLAVELSSFQLHWSATIAPLAAAVLNVTAHHLDWHGDIESYAADKGKIYAAASVAVCNADDARTVALAAAARPPRTVAFRLGAPRPGELGVAAGQLTDRAFAEISGAGDSPAGRRADGGVPLAAVADVRPAAPHNVADALAAAALARAYGCPPAAIAGGLAAFAPEPHRITLVAQVGGVDYVDDSKATNTAAAAASLAAYPSVVWVAGGLFKGTDAELDALVTAAAGGCGRRC